MLYKIRINKFLSKLSFTLFIILLMIFTRYVSLPGVDRNTYLVETGSNLDLLSSATGASLAQISLTTLGLSPWMSAMILMRIFFLGGRKDINISEQKRNRWTNRLVLLLSILQGLGISLNLEYNYSVVSFPLMVLQTTVILVSGSFILMWLANLNSVKGFGGLSIIILSNIIVSRLNTIDKVRLAIAAGQTPFLIFLSIWVLMAICLIVIMEKAEYQIPVHRVSINNKYVEDSYIPLKLNISGGLAFMYSFSILMIPQYFFLLLSYFFPKVSLLPMLSSYFSTLTLPGVIIYMVILFSLCIIFAFVNVDITMLTKQLRNSGDFIEDLRPGNTTKTYLHQKVRSIGVINGSVLTIISALPMLMGIGNTMLADLATMVGMTMMMSSMILMLIEEVRVIKLVKQYKSVFDS